MKTYAILGLTTLCGQLIYAQTLPLLQSFEEDSSDNWNFATNPAAFNSGDGDIWDRLNESKYIGGASDGSWFWESRDFDGQSTADAGYLTFETVDLTSIGACTLTFDYYASGGLESIDGIGYEILYNNLTNWDGAVWIKFDQDTSKEWVTATIPIPAEKDYLRLRLRAYTSADAEYVGFDNIELKVTPPNQPALNITEPSETRKVAESVSSLTFSGTCENCVGDIIWSNTISGISGKIAAVNDWSIPDLPIAPTNNLIVVTGTNSAGVAVSDSVIIYREIGITVAFTAFNAARDAFAFIALTDIAAETEIIFTDEEWGGSSFVSPNLETDLIWNSDSGVDAGRVVVIDFCDDKTRWSANYGKITSDKNMDLAQKEEDIYVYIGEPRKPTIFLTAVTISNGKLTGTALEYGVDAISLNGSAEYSGPRTGFDTYMEYLTLLCAPSNWTALTSAPDNTPFGITGSAPFPMLSILSPERDTFVEGCVSGIMVSGTTANVTGYISWSNHLNGVSGELETTEVWCIDTVCLSAGANLITVTATNSAGLIATDTIEIARACQLSQEFIGAIAFTSFNSVTDSFSFVVLKGIDAGTVIRFTDGTWDGLKFDTKEDDMIWSNSVATSAGTVVTVKACDTKTEITVTPGFVDGYLRLAQTGDEIYAYLGDAKREPSAFLAMISTSGAELRGTGLAFNQSAVDIKKTPKSQYYNGIRGGEKAWSDYLPLINNADNWTDTEDNTESWGDPTPFDLKRARTTIIMVQ